MGNSRTIERDSGPVSEVGVLGPSGLGRSPKGSVASASQNGAGDSFKWVVSQFEFLVNATSADSISSDLRSKNDTSFPLSPRAVGFTIPRCISARALRAFSTELAKFPW